jgi:hypothetical protein
MDYECDCVCHTDQSIMHIEECCEGKCHGCGKYFFNLEKHMATCQAFQEWRKKQKRKFLKKNNL